MNEPEYKRQIEQSLAQFSHGSLRENGIALLNTLGYRSERQIVLEPSTFNGLVDVNPPIVGINKAKALVDDWQSVDILFQLTDDDIRSMSQGHFIFENARRVDDQIIESYLFIAIELKQAEYSRSKLADLTREVNKYFAMPVMILFKHGSNITLSIINRRLNKREESKDVLEKVTLIKGINLFEPLRAHIEILFDLSLNQLQKEFAFQNFVELHNAWQKTLDTSELNKKFYREIADWYFWAVKQVTFPAGNIADVENRNATNVIRLITRLIFVWFIKEKGLVPETLFNERDLKEILLYNDSQSSTFYKAILQNLFFATLNTEMGEGRRFRGKNKSGGMDAHHGISTVYRYEDYFRDPQSALKLFADIPFLNGGLFECLDKREEKLLVDGFSDDPRNQPVVPDKLFFCKEDTIDLNDVYGDTRHGREKVRGLIHIFNSYKFTIEENTPLEEEIALDPELLGKVFENLLAAYNPETGTTARKQTGSFYTPREIVNYMVDEALIAYLESKLEGAPELQPRLRHLLAYNQETHQFDDKEALRLISAIDAIKVLDPACGSGAFPMGILHKLVFILSKLDPGNRLWKQKQIDKASEIPDPNVRDQIIEDIDRAFNENELDFGRKLYLIENCIYGVDIQPIAVQIAKLRFFISLVVDQKINRAKPNLGIRPLPNLETKFVAANTLIGIEKPQQMAFKNPAVEQKEKELAEVRAAIFTARTPATKQKYRQKDAALRAELAELLKADGWGAVAAAQLAKWDPYDQNSSSDFFDPEWMFGVTDGFDVVIGNPPYGVEIEARKLKSIMRNVKDTKNSNSAAIFIDFSKNKLVHQSGIVALIVPKSLFYSEKWFSQAQALSQHTSIIVDVEKAFENVLLEQVVFIFNWEIDSKIYQSQKFQNGEFSQTTIIPQYMINKFQAWICGVNNAELDLGVKISEIGTFMKEISTTCRGLPIQRTLRQQGQIPIIGGKNLYRYGIYHPKGYINHQDIDTSNKKISFLLQPKVISQNIVAHIQNPKPHIMIISAPDLNGDILSVDTINNTIITDTNYSPNFISALFNSTLINWYVYRFVFCAAIRTMHFDEYYIGKIPIPILKIQDQTDIVKIVDSICATKNTDPNANTFILESTINRLIYQFYSLTNEEISIVENGCL
jgi:adenine-specific DNA-methyltransferase